MEEELVKLSYWTSMLKQETDCAICLQTLRDPVTTKCSHTFCKACISRVVINKASCICPLCNAQIHSRGREINSKIKSFIEKINPIIELIKNESSIDVLSYHKGKSTTSLADGTTRINFTSVDSTEISKKETVKLNSKSTESEAQISGGLPSSSGLTIDKVVTSSDELKPRKSRLRAVNNRNVSLDKEEEVSVHCVDNFSDLDHLSVSQNVQNTRSRKSSLKIPVAENLKSPAKKVKEWLSKNCLEDCNSQNLNREAEAPINCSMDDDKETIENKKENADESNNELHLNRSYDKRFSRKVYKGLKKGLKDHGDISKKFRKSIECDIDSSSEEKDIIQDSCPVEINDTFDKLICDAKQKVSEDKIPPPVDDNENQNSIGLFESLPMPTEDNSFKKKRSHEKFKLNISNSSVLGLNSGKLVNRNRSYKKKNDKLNNRTLGSIELGNSSMSEEKLMIVTDNVREEPSNDTTNKDKIMICEETSEKDKIGIKSNTNLIEDSKISVLKSGKKRSDLSSTKWPNLNNTLKDFQESKKSTIAVLDVSGGDPHQPSTSKSNFSKFLSVSFEKVTSHKHIDDNKNSHLQSDASKNLISSKITDVENAPKTSFPGKKENCFGLAVKRLSCDDNKKVNINMSSSTKCEEDARITSNEKLGLDNAELKQSSDNYINENVNMKPDNESQSDKKKSNLNSRNSLERRKFPLNLSADDLHGNPEITKRKSFKGKDFLKDSVIASNQSFEKNFKSKTPFLNYRDVSDSNAVRNKFVHRKIVDSTANRNVDSEKIALSKGCVNQLAARPKLLMPIFKLGSLKEKKSVTPRVKYVFLGKVRHFDSLRKKHDASMVTDSLTSQNMRSLADQKSVGIQTELEMVNADPTSPVIQEDPDVDNFRFSHRRSLKRLQANRISAMSAAEMTVMGDNERSLVAEEMIRESGESIRRSGYRKPVCQLFSATDEGTPSELNETIATPIVSEGMSQQHKYNKIEFLRHVKSKNPSIITLSSSGSSSNKEVDSNHDKCSLQKENVSPSKSFSWNEESELNPSRDGHNIGGTKTLDNGGFSGTGSSGSDDKLAQILANVKSDLEGNGKKEKDYKSLDHIFEIPETASMTPGYVDESEVSDNECSEKNEDNIKPMDDDVQMMSDDNKALSDEDSDCIVEGSQKKDTSMERPLIRKGPISLIASGLLGKEVAQVKHFAEVFNLHFSPQFNGSGNTSGAPCTTHVITKEDSEGKTSCTFKYLCGMITGCWIISIKWVIDCLAADKLLEVQPYELLDASGGSKTSRDLQGNQKLFAGFQFIYKEPLTSLTAEQLKYIVQLGGGKIFSIGEKPPDGTRKCVAIADASIVDSDSSLCKFLSLQKIAIVSCEWVIECIEEYRILSLLNYVLNVEPEADPSHVCKKLMEMGYDEDLVKLED